MRLRIVDCQLRKRFALNLRSVGYNVAVAQSELSNSVEEPALLCPACGFDLRATASDRCGECGLPFDRAMLTISGIPWAHRRTMGRVRAHFATQWRITLDRASIRHEAAKAQEMSDARSFRRVNAWILALALLAGFAAAVYFNGDLAFLAVQPRDLITNLIGSQPPTGDPWWYDLAVPWSAGATIAPVVPICLILLAFWLTGAQRFVFRVPRSYSAVQRERALCLSHYTAAPLLYLLLSVLLTIAAVCVSKALNDGNTGPMPGIVLAMGLASLAIALAALLATFARTAQWLIRTRNCGAGLACLNLLELLGLWILGAIVLLGLFPWCIGFLWVAVDSLR